MLTSILFDCAEGAIKHAAVGVDGHSHAEELISVGGVTVEPRAVVHVSIRGGRMGDWLRRLMNWIVVESIQHLSSSNF